MDLLHMTMSDALALPKSASQAVNLPSYLEARMNSKQLSAHATVPTHSGLRVVKRRASRACHYCRAKKIKCSVVKSGSPCNTCRLDEVECLVSPVRRKRRPRVNGVLVDRLSAPSQLKHQQGNLLEQNLPVNAILASTAPVNVHEDVAQETLGHQQPSDSPFATPAAGFVQLSPLQPLGTPHLSPAQLQAKPQFPNYIRPFHLELNADDFAVLSRKGVFTLPGLPLRTELLRKYVQYVHPLLPLLDLCEFLTALASDDGHVQISLMLFYAFMSAASSYADMQLLCAEGFADRKDARKAFFQRAKLLYEFEYETDRISLVQALLLMTYWYEKPDDQKDPSFWLGESLSFAYTIGLHQQNDHDRIDVQKQRLRRRMWWCIYIRDQLITLSMRKPNRIKTEWDVPMLLLDDFDTQPLDQNMIRLLGDCPAMSDVATRTTLAKLCIEKAKLCICIHHILATQYSETLVNMAREDMAPDDLIMLTPRQAVRGNMEVIRCEQQLDEWNESLPQECYFRERRSSNPGPRDLKVLSLHRAVLNMLYLTASSALHRPHVVSELPSRQNMAFNLQSLSLKRARETAIDITNIAKDLKDHDSARFLPPVGVTVLMPAMTIHLLELKADPTLDNPSIRRFQQCVEILHTLQDIFHSADYGYAFVDAAVRKSNIEIVQGNERRHVQGITDIMDLRDSLTAQCEAGIETLAPKGRVDEPNLLDTSVPRAPILSSDSAGTAIEQLSESASVFGDFHVLSDGFEAFINFDAFSDSFGAGAGLGVDLDGFWTSNL